MGSKVKIKKILGAILLGGLFMTAVVLFSIFYSKKEGAENQETTKKYVTVRPLAKSFEMGEDVEVDGCVYNVKTAELIADYNELDVRYQNGGYLSTPLEFIKSLESMELEWIDYGLGVIFPEEVKFLHLNFSITNTGDTEKKFFPARIGLSSKNHHLETGSQWQYISFYSYDGQYVVTGDSDEEIKLIGQKAGETDTDFLEENFFIQPGKTLNVDFVGEFLEYAEDRTTSGNRYNYDLYLPAYGTGIEDIDNREERVRLNITRSYVQVDGTEQAPLYEEAKDIQGMKSRSWTNLELAEQKTSIYPRTEEQKETSLKRGETEEAGQEYLQFLHVSRGIENVINRAYKFISKPVSFQIAEWKDMPEEYKEKGNLQRMAQRYQNIYGYEEEELKVLLLDISYSAEAMGELYPNSKTQILSFYENSYLYTKESEGEWKMFGMADDWKVTENSENPENIGWLNRASLSIGQNISVQMAYILPPALYQKYDALYFAGGWLWDNSAYDSMVPVTRIVLK